MTSDSNTDAMTDLELLDQFYLFRTKPLSYHIISILIVIHMMQSGANYNFINK